MDTESTRAGAAGNRDQILADERRRAVLDVLEDAGTRMAEADLAVELARRETGDADADGTYDEARRLRVPLYHCDLPKLAAAGLVDHDRDERTVALTDDASTDEPERRRVPAER